MPCCEGTRSREAAEAPPTVRQANPWAAGAEASSESSASPVASRSPLTYTEVMSHGYCCRPCACAGSHDSSCVEPADILPLHPLDCQSGPSSRWKTPPLGQ